MLREIRNGAPAAGHCRPIAIAVTELPRGSGAARRLLGLISLIPLAVDLGLEPFWTPVRLMP